MTIWNLHGTGIQLRIIHSTRTHSNLQSFVYLFCLIFVSFLHFSLSTFPRHSTTKQFYCRFYSCALTHIHSLSLTHDLTLARFIPRRANQLPDIIYLVFCMFFLYSVCLYSYNNHFPNDYTLNSSNFLHFFTNNNWIVAPNFLSAHFFVIEFAIVLVTVSMHGAE